MVHFWRMEMEKGEIWGRHPLDIPKTGKPWKNQPYIHRVGENVPKPSHFPVIPYEICWMTIRWLYQHGLFVVSCRDTVWISKHKHPLISPKIPGWNERENSRNVYTFQFTKELKLNYHWGIFSQLGPFVCTFIILWHFEGNRRKISMWKYPQWFSREKRGEYPHRKFSFISPEFPQGNYEKISTGMISWNSPIIHVEIWATRMASPLG